VDNDKKDEESMPEGENVEGGETTKAEEKKKKKKKSSSKKNRQRGNACVMFG